MTKTDMRGDIEPQVGTEGGVGVFIRERRVLGVGQRGGSIVS